MSWLWGRPEVLGELLPSLWAGQGHQRLGLSALVCLRVCERVYVCAYLLFVHLCPLVSTCAFIHVCACV